MNVGIATASSRREGDFVVREAAPVGVTNTRAEAAVKQSANASKLRRDMAIVQK